MKKKIIVIVMMSFLLLNMVGCESDEEQGNYVTGESIDLTEMSDTMSYVSLTNILMDPYANSGKKIKLKGKYTINIDENTGKEYPTCINEDATNCCFVMIEFLQGKEAKYPDDYPEVDESIIIEGIFEIYEDNEKKYCRLSDAIVEVIE